MRRIVVCMDALPTLREATSCQDVDLPAAVTLAELAGMDAVRLGVNEDLKPVREEDLREARRAARVLELRMPPSQALFKVALEANPDRVVVAGSGRDGRSPAGPLDLRGRGPDPEPVVRALGESGIAVAAVIAPDLDAVKAAHSRGFDALEFYTGAIVDLPTPERQRALEKLGEGVRLASKLGLGISVGGGLGYRNLPEVLRVCAAAESVSVGRAVLSRAILVGLDRALRDLRAIVS